MIFTFDLKIYPDNYTNDFYKKFAPFSHCDMVVKMNSEPLNYFTLESAINRRGKIQGLSLDRNDFLDVLNNALSATFIECPAAYGMFKIGFSFDFHNATGKHRKYKKYNTCRAEFDAEKVFWNWY